MIGIDAQNIATELERFDVLSLNWNSRKTNDMLRPNVRVAVLDITVKWAITVSRTDEQLSQHPLNISISLSLLRSFIEILNMSSAKISGAP